MNATRFLPAFIAILVVLGGGSAALVTPIDSLRLQALAGAVPQDDGPGQDYAEFARSLTEIATKPLPDHVRGLLVAEHVSRQQVAQLGLEWEDTVFIPDHALPGDAVRGLAEHLGGVVGPEQAAALDEMDALDPPVRDALASVVDAFHGMHLATANAYAEADMDYLERLQETAEATPPDPSWVQKANVNLQDIFAARLKLLEASYELKHALEETDDEVVPSLVVPMGHQNEEPEHPTDPGDLSNDGICINSHDANNVYNDDCILLIDTTHADKKYHNNAGGHSGRGASALIDFAGDNQYGDPEDPGVGGKNGGALTTGIASPSVGNLLSLGGGDGIFSADDGGVNGGGFASAGSAIGLLLNAGGNDRYVAHGRGLGDGFEGGGVNGGAESRVSGYASGLLLDMAGENHYRDQTIPRYDDTSYQCMEAPGGECRFESHGDDTNSCWNCSVMPKGEVIGGSEVIGGTGAHINFAVPEDVDVSPPETPACNENDCLRFWFHGPDSEVDDDLDVAVPMAVSSEIPGRLLTNKTPEGAVPVVHTGSDSDRGAETYFPIVLSTDALDDEIVLDWSQNATAHIYKMVGSFAEQEPSTKILGRLSINQGGDICHLSDADNPPREEFSLEFSFEQGAELEDQCEVDENQGLIVPQGSRLQFTIWVVEDIQSFWEIYRSLTFSMMYGSQDFPSHLDLPVVPDFTPDVIQIDWDENLGSDGDGRLILPAGEDVSFVAIGTNTSTGKTMNVPVDWNVDPAERGSFAESSGLYTPDIEGTGTITATWDDDISDSVAISVVPGQVAEIRILEDGNGGSDHLENLGVDAGDPREIHAVGFDEKGNPVDGAEFDWSVEPDAWADSSFGGGPDFLFRSETAGEGTITVEKSGVQATTEIEVHPVELDSIEIHQEIDVGGETERQILTDLTVTAGQSLTLFAAGYDEFGNYRGDEQAVWEVTPEVLGEITAATTGVTFHPEQGPDGIIEATVGAFSRSINVDINPGDPDRLGVEGFQTWTVDESSALTIRIEDLFGNPVGYRPGDLDGAGVEVQLQKSTDAEGGEGSFSGTMETIVDDNGEAEFTDLRYCCKTGSIELLANLTQLGDDGEELLSGAVVEIEVQAGPLNHVLIQDAGGNSGLFEVDTEGTLDLQAAGFDEFGNPRGNEEVTWNLEGEDWNGPADWTLDPNGPLVRFSSNTAGHASVRASPNGGPSGVNDAVAQIDVRPSVLHHIRIEVVQNGDRQEITNHLTSLGGGQDVVLRAAGYDQHENYQGDVPVDWTIEPADRGTLDKTQASPTVRFTAKEIGEGFINVTGPVPVGNDVLPVSVTDPGSPGELVFRSPAEPATAGQTWSPIKVHVEDGFGNHVASDDATRVRLSLGDGFAEALDGTLVAQATDGIATFDTVSYTVADEIWIVAESIDGNGQVMAGIQDIAHGPYTVQPADLDSIRIQEEGPDGRTDVTAMDLTAGGEVALFAAGFDAFGNPVGQVSSAWAVDPEGSGAFDSTQGSSVTFTPETAGQGDIHASKDGLQASVELRVAAGSLDMIQIRDAPDGGGKEVESLRLPTGQETDLYAAGYDAHGNYIQDVSVWWRVDPTRLGSLETNEPQDHVTFLAKDGGTGRIVVDHDDLAGDVTLILTVDADAVPPYAAITASCSELTCTLDADSTAGDSPITNYEWDIGDGNRAKQEHVTHTYAEPGAYDVTLTVTDEDGLFHEAHQAVTVALPPDPVIELRLETRADDPAPGAMTANARLDNVGSVALEHFRVVFTLDDEVLREQSYARLEAGENMTISAAWEARQGNHTVVVAVPDRASASQVIEVILPVMDKGAPPDQEAPAPGVVLLLLALAAPWIQRRSRLHDSKNHPDALEAPSDRRGPPIPDETPDRTTEAIQRGPRP